MKSVSCGILLALYISMTPVMAKASPKCPAGAVNKEVQTAGPDCQTPGCNTGTGVVIEQYCEDAKGKQGLSVLWAGGENG